MTNNLEKNLKLRKALAEVDRLTAKIVHIESFIEKEIKINEEDTKYDDLLAAVKNEQIEKYKEILKLTK